MDREPRPDGGRTCSSWADGRTRPRLADLISALGQLPRPRRSTTEIATLASTRDAEVRLVVAQALGDVTHAIPARPSSALIVLSRDPVDEVRSWATFGAGRARCLADAPGVCDALKARLDDPSTDVRVEAERGLFADEDPGGARQEVGRPSAGSSRRRLAAESLAIRPGLACEAVRRPASTIRVQPNDRLFFDGLLAPARVELGHVEVVVMRQRVRGGGVGHDLVEPRVHLARGPAARRAAAARRSRAATRRARAGGRSARVPSRSTSRADGGRLADDLAGVARARRRGSRRRAPAPRATTLSAASCALARISNASASAASTRFSAARSPSAIRSRIRFSACA